MKSDKRLKNNNTAKIAIIDGGIYKSKLEHPEYVIKQICLVPGDEEIQGEHGTNCARILERCSAKYELIDIKIVQNWKVPAGVEIIIVALQKCIEENVDFVCISAGTEYLSEYEKFKKIFRQFEIENIIVIAAISNYGYVTLPAAYRNVIGVIMDWNHVLEPMKCMCVNHPLLGDYIVANIQSHVSENDYPRGNSYAVPSVMKWILENVVYNVAGEMMLSAQAIVLMFPKYHNYLDVNNRSWGRDQNIPVLSFISASCEVAQEFKNFLIEEYKLETVLVIAKRMEIDDFEIWHDCRSLEQLLLFIDRYVKCHIILCYFECDERGYNEMEYDLEIMEKQTCFTLKWEDQKMYSILKEYNWKQKVAQKMIEILN